MALIKDIISPSGAIVQYWVVDRLKDLDLHKKQCVFTVTGYYTKEAYKAQAAPMGSYDFAIMNETRVEQKTRPASLTEKRALSSISPSVSDEELEKVPYDILVSSKAIEEPYFDKFNERLIAGEWQKAAYEYLLTHPNGVKLFEGSELTED